MNEPAARLSRSHRIGIIGGGCAGVHLAHLLKHRGYGRLTVLERGPRVGGKARTVPHRGFPHELGACYIAPHYAEFRRLVGQYGVGRLTAPAVYRRSIYTSEFDGCLTQYDFDGYSRAVTNGLRAPERRHRPARRGPAGPLVRALLRYYRLRRRLLGGAPMPLARRPADRSLPELSTPFMELVDHHRLHAMLPYFRLATSAQGYGILETIPALYVLLWNTPALVGGFILSRLGLGRPVVTMPEAGVQTLFEEIVRQDGLDVRVDTEVRAVRRSGGGRPVDVSVCQRGESHELQFDQVVLATDFRDALGYLTPATPQEQEVFGALTGFTFVTTLFAAERWPASAPMAYNLDALVPGGGSTVSGVRDICFTFPGAANGEACSGVAYQFLDRPATGEDLADLDRRFAGEMSDLGFAGVRIVERATWPYFPHFSREGVARGFPWAVFEMQGTAGTWYAGSSACFESMNDVMIYNRALVDRFAEG